MSLVFFIGRLLYGGFFLWSGVNHLRRNEAMGRYASARKVPAPRTAVASSGLLIIAGGASVILGLWPGWVLALVVIFLVPVSLTMHNYWAATEPAARAGDLTHFKKNAALLGAALMLYAVPQPWPWSVHW